MAWSWSHAGEAYANARTNLEELPLTTLHVIYAEWRASDWGSKRFDYVCTQHDSRKYWDALRYAAESLDRESLVETLWEWIEEFATCDNGGFDAWICPHGCHTVSFDYAETETLETGE